MINIQNIPDRNQDHLHQNKKEKELLKRKAISGMTQRIL
jgi:hypothetical protein